MQLKKISFIYLSLEPKILQIYLNFVPGDIRSLKIDIKTFLALRLTIQRNKDAR